MPKQYYVYILTNSYNTILYTGITGHLEGRVKQHKDKESDGFTKRYNATKLAYYEEFDTPYEAILREKQIKCWSHKKKRNIVTMQNPKWKDLSDGWYQKS